MLRMERILRMGRCGATAPNGRVLFVFGCFVGETRLANRSMPERQFPKNPSPGITSRGHQEELSRMIRLNPEHPYNPPS
jgi:hypothetical protein